MMIRQVALAARELDPVVDDLCAVLGTEVCFNDPGVGEFGLKNALMTVGTQLLEVVAPKDPGSTAERFLDRRGGDSGYMLILQTTDLKADRKRAEDMGIRVVWESEYPDIASFHLHPKDVGGAIVSIDQPLPPESWRWGGPDWEQHIHTDVTDTMLGVTVQSEDPAAMARRWAEFLDCPEQPSENGAHTIPLENGQIDFAHDTDGRGPGISVITVHATDKARALDVARQRKLPVTDSSVTIGGTIFEFVGD